MSDPSAPEESADLLIERAAVADYTVTKDQLARWHRVDLLPRPRQASHGRAGTEAMYPPGTAAQLLDLLELKSRDRRLATVRWGLWWRGYPVPDRWARQFIYDQVQSMLKTYRELLTPDGDLTEKAHAALDMAPTAEIETGTLRRARRRVGTEDFDFFMQDLLLVGYGHVDLVKDEDLERLEHGMALDRARIDKLGSIGGPWLTTDRREDFDNIAKLNDPMGHLKILEEATDEALRGARDTGRRFMPVISNLGAVMRQTVGPSAFGYGAFGRVFDEIGDTPSGQALVMVVLLAASAAGFDEGIHDTVSHAEEAARLPVRFEILKALREEVPELQPIISDQRLGAAMQDAAKQAKLQEDILAARRQLGAEMDAFFVRHPEYHEHLKEEHPGQRGSGQSAAKRS